MIYGSYRYQKTTRCGRLEGDRVLLLPEGYTFFDIIERGESLPWAEAEPVALEHLEVLAPIPYPRRNPICLGKNYFDHAMELAGKTSNLEGVPEAPIYFSKMAYPVLGTETTLLLDELDGLQLDYEVEVALIIGKGGKNIPAAEAFDHVFGYTLSNDFSARTLQIKHTQWFKGKSLDGLLTMGPYVVTADAFERPPRITIESRVNGELRQSGHLGQLIFDIPTIIEDLSKNLTLVPGDIILTGTPKGVGMGFDPPKYLHVGDEVVCTGEKLGKLVNRIG